MPGAPPGAAAAGAPASPDRAGLDAVIGGDPRARRAFVREHQRAVFAVISRVLGGRGTRELTEDLAQETFLRAFRALPRFDRAGSAKVSTWMLRIATNAAIDELRRPRREEPGDAATFERLPGRERSDAGARQAMLAARVERALSGLRPEFRAAFVLRAFHELSHAEIAEVLEVEVGTVKSRVARARAQLRRELAELEAGDDDRARGGVA